MAQRFANDRRALGLVLGPLLLFTGVATAAGDVAVDLAGYNPDCGIKVETQPAGEGPGLTVVWPLTDDATERGRLGISLQSGGPLVSEFGVVSIKDNGLVTTTDTVLGGILDPVTFVTVGTRKAPAGRPPSMSEFNVFFDSPADRPHRSYRSRLEIERVRVASRGHRVSIILGTLTIGPFRGELWINVYRGSRLIHVEAVVSTSENHCAYLYDAGLIAWPRNVRQFAWIDTEGELRRAPAELSGGDRPLAVRHRTIVAEFGGGLSVACFPPPHQYFFPRDNTDNLKTVWFGKDHRDLDDRYGFGVRQSETGGGRFVPWFNAPPGTEQRLGVFYLLSRGEARDALRETLRYTHGDRFPELPGHVTFSSHWHMALTVAAMRERARGSGRTTPDLVSMFKDMNVNIVHLAEFHGDGHQFDPGPLRLPEVEAMFAECRRLSDDRLLLLPGEEVSGVLGLSQPGKHPGHWMCLFPRPVTWIIKRPEGQPFVEQDPRSGTVYRVGGRDDMVRLLEREHGLAWTSHPRIKASSWTPDIFRDEDFFKADFWLGAAWKAMPADLSRPRLGDRALDLLDDMANWGRRKYLVGEVDVFKVDHTHELYGHMNVNYLRLDRVPRFDEGWQPVLDALRGGHFFVTTGEVRVRDFTVGGQGSGATLTRTPGDHPELRMTLDWTFPLRFAEVVSGDGAQVHRERIDLDETGPFGERTMALTPNLDGRKWVRVAAWDVAGNGSFTQPVWLAGPDDARKSARGPGPARSPR